MHMNDMLFLHFGRGEVNSVSVGQTYPFILYHWMLFHGPLGGYQSKICPCGLPPSIVQSALEMLNLHP